MICLINELKFNEVEKVKFEFGYIKFESLLRKWINGIERKFFLKKRKKKIKLCNFMKLSYVRVLWFVFEEYEFYFVVEIEFNLEVKDFKGVVFSFIRC